MVADHFLWKSMMAPDVFQEQLGDSSGIQGGDCGYGVNPFRQVIHHHEGSIVPLGVQEFSDHVYGDHLPALVRDLVGDQLPVMTSSPGDGIGPEAGRLGLSHWAGPSVTGAAKVSQSFYGGVMIVILAKGK